MKKRYALFGALLFCLTAQIKGYTNGPIGSPSGGIDPYTTSLGATQFRNAGQTSLLKTYTVTSAGYYKFTADIASVISSGNTATVGGACALFINASDVVIDLAGRTLSYGASTNNQNGIEIASGVHNVTIKNGHISGFTKQAVLIRNSCNNIHLENLTISNCHGPSIYFLGTSTGGEDIRNVTIENVFVSNTTGASDDAVGLKIEYGWNFLVTNSSFSRSISSTDDAYGVLVTGNCRNLVFKNCDASGNEGDSAAGFAFLGTDVSEGCSLINCTANNNYGKESNSAGYGYGFAFTSVISDNDAGAKSAEGFTLENCIAQGNKGAASAHGFYFGNADYFYIKNCKAIYNHALSGATAVDPTDGAHGFSCYMGFGHVFENCTALGNVSEQDTNAIISAGFFAEDSENLIFTNCEANNNQISSHASSEGAGFYLSASAAPCVNCVIRNCKASNHRGTGTGYGFYDADTTSSTLVTDCIAFGNTTNYSITYATGSLNKPGQFGPGELAAITALQPLENLDLTAS